MHAALRLVAAAVLAAAAAPILGCASAPSAPEGPAEAGRDESAAAFERLKALAGAWHGSFGMGGEAAGTADVGYRVTSGGATVEETLFGGSPHEMVTMYHLDGPRLLLTHYCAAGNQPTMVLQPGSGDGVLRFEFLRGTNMEPADGHMHRAVIDLSEEGRMKATWTYFENGQAGPDAVIDARRKE